MVPVHADVDPGDNRAGKCWRGCSGDSQKRILGFVFQDSAGDSVDGVWLVLTDCFVFCEA